MISSFFRRDLKLQKYSGLDESHTLTFKFPSYFILIGFSFLLAHLTKNLIVGAHFGDTLVTFSWTALLGVLYILQLLEKINLSKLVTIIVGGGILFAIHITFGAKPNREALYIFFLFCSIFFFNLRLSLFLSLYIIILYLIASSYNLVYSPLIRKEVNLETTTIEYFMFVVVCIVIISHRLVRKIHLARYELLEKNTELKKKNEQLREFNYLLSHDLKEPLRSIVSFSQLIEREESLDKNREYLNFIITSGQQMHTLIEDIALLQQNLQNIDYEMLSISELVKDVKVKLYKEIAEKNVTVNVIDDASFYAPKPWLLIILQILLSNAFKYNNSDPIIVNLTVKIAPESIFVEIEDNGQGIEKEYQGNIFRRFKRSSSNSFRGSGLGLNIAKKFAQKLNGDVLLLSSKPNVGSTFQVYFENTNHLA